MKTLHTIYNNFAKHNMASLRLLLVMLLTLTASTAWAETYSWTCSGTTVFNTSGSSLNGVNWKASIEGSSAGTGVSGEKCVQIAKNNGLTLETTGFNNKNITSISIQTWGSQENTFYLKDGDTQLATTQIPKSYSSNGAKISFSDVGVIKTKLVFSWSSATKAFNVRSITITYEDAAPYCSVKPTVGTTLQSVTATENSIKATIPITAVGGCNITENGLVYSTTNSTPTVDGSGCTTVTTTACGSTAANKTVTITGLTCGQSYYIRGYATNEAGTSYTDVTTQSTSDCPKYTVTLKDDNSTLTQSTAGGSVDLPSRDGCYGYEFVGWTKSWDVAQTTWTTTAPTIIPAGSYTPTGDENLYPVYTKTEGGGTSYQFQQVTALSQIKAGGTFIITNGSYYLPNTEASSSGPLKADMVEVTNGVVTGTVTDAMKWTFSEAADDGKITIKSAANSTHYLYTTSSNNGLRVNNTSDTWTFEEYTVSDILGFAMKSTSNSRYCAVYTGGSDWRSYTTKNAGNYETNSGRLDLYKSTEISSNTTYYISVPDCDPCNALQAPNVTAKNITTNSFTLSWAAVLGATSYNIYNYTTEETDETTDLTYTFNGLEPDTEYEWEVEAVSATCDGKGTTGTTTTLKTYTITWKNADGTVLEIDENVPHGTTPTYNGATPTKTATAQYTYTFSDWSPTIYAADKDQIYTAQFNETTRQYTVTFDANGHGSAPANQIVDYGTKVTEPSAPTAIGYTFGGWYKEKECTNAWDFTTDVVTGNITLYAKWTEKALTRYRTKCDACIPLDGYAEINGTYHFFPGETITLTVTPPADDVPYTYQWQKKVNSDYEDIEGETGLTYTKENATTSDVGHYRCVVSSEGYCDLTPKFDVKCLQLYVYYDNKSDVFNTPLNRGAEENTATISVDLQNASYKYYFKITDGCGNWYGNTGTMVRDNCTNWPMDVNEYCGLQTTKFGTYVFNVNYSDLAHLTVSVIYPAALQEAGKVIYLDNNVLKWNHSDNADGTNKIYYRIGRGDHNNKTAMTLVPGTANLYKGTTSEYNNFEVWHIANNGCWSEGHPIYKTNTGDDWAATQATAFETLPVTLESVTVTPTTSIGNGGEDRNSNCEFFNYDITEGMKTWNAEVIEPTNGTITVKYTHHDGTAVNNFTSGNRNLAHTCLLTITATANEGYSLTSLTVNDEPFTSGDVHTLTEDAVIQAEFTINTHTVRWKLNGGNIGGNENDIVQEYEYGAVIEAPEKPTFECYEFVEWTPTYNAEMTMPDEDLVFTATWNKLSYNITFQNWDGSELQSSTVECGETPSYTGATPTREQTAQYTYTFKGWLPTIAPATKNQDYTAQFDEVTRSYTVTWMVGTTEYTAGTPTNQVEYNKKVTILPTSPQDDAIGTCANKFIGWSTKSSGSNAENADYYDDLFTTAENSPAITDATTFYAVFATEEETTGGTVEATLSFANTAQRTSLTDDKAVWQQNNITLTNTKGTEQNAANCATYVNPVRFYKYSKIKVEHTSNYITKIVFTCNTEEYAQNLKTSIGDNAGATVALSSNEVIVEFNSSVEAFEVKLSNQVRMDQLTVTAGGGTITTYSNYVTNCCATPVPTNGSYTSPSGTSVTLTWDGESTRYHITGNGLDDYTYDESYTVTGLTECNEYTFYVSAYPAEGCESAAIQISAQPFSGAKTVTFNPNGGVVSPTSFTTSCDKKSTTLPTPTYSGYRFMGWFTAESGGTEIDDNLYTPTEDITLFAHWEKEYTVTYDLQGGTASPVCSGDKYIAGEIVTICTSTPVKSGYRFTGWTYSPVITITNGQFTMPASNVTITAEFVARAVTNIEVATNTHRVLMQGSAFIGEQIRVTYDNGETELLEWSNSKLTFAGHNTNELGVQTVTVTYTGEGTAHTQYNIEVIDGLGITFWDGDYTETIKYEPGDLVDVDNKIGQSICDGWEFVGWSETKVANESNGFTPVHNFNATDAKVLYAVYAEIRMVKEGDVLKEQYKSADMVTDLQEGARYIVAAYVNSNNSSYGYTALTPNSKDTYYMAGTHTANNGFAYTEEKNDDNSNIYCTTYEIDSNNLWRIESDGDGYWQLFNIATKKYLDLSAHENQYLTTNNYPNGKIVIYDYISSIGDNDSRLELRHSTEESDGNKLYWDRKAECFRQTVSTSGLSCIYCLTKDKSFTSTPPCSPLSATFHGNGGTVTDGVKSGDNLTITEPTRDAGITTPTATFADCNGKSWTFVGWSRKEIDVTRVPVLTTDLLHDGGGNKHYYIQEDGEEFWAVYTNQGTPETKYGTITFTKENFPNTYDNISKSCTIVENGDSYNFYYTNVAKPSSNSIQIEEGKGYLTNTTSLGKINSISFTNFIYGNINCLKVSLGTSADALTTVLTAEELQVVDGVYTYYPKANYSFFKIESIEDAGAVGIETISIDFGKGTQIWATTPDCSTITLSGDEIYITATNGRAIMASAPIAVKANQLEANANVILTSTSSDVYFSTDRTFNFAAGQAAGQKPTTSLTLPTDAEGNLATTDVYIHYMPSSEGDGVPANVIISANLETPNPSITDDHTIHVRNLPAKFVIATKVGATWYALPADMTDDTNPLAEVIEVDEATMTATAPNTTTYTLWPVKTTNGTGNRYADYGDRLRFAAVNYEQRGLWANNNNNSSAIRNYAVINSLGADGTAAYEWKVTTTVVDGHWQYTLQTDQTQNQNYLRYWTSAEGTPVGPKWGTYNAGENKLYFLPVTETQPFEYAVVEWYPTKMLIQTDAAITSPTVKVGGEKVASPILTSKGGKLYEISNLPLEINPNEVLQVSFTADAVNYVNAKVVPIILSRGEKSITGEPFATLTQKVYQYADVVVRDGATLTIDGGTDVANTLLSVTIYPTAKVSVAEGKKLSVHNLTFFGGIDEIYDGSAYTINKYGVPQLSLKGILNKTVTNMDYIMRVNLDQMYQVGVPYDVNLSDITYWDGTTMTLGDNLYVSAYDGQKRANREEKSWVWETDFTEKVLKAGIGYTISADKQDAAHEYSIIRMPMKNNIASGNTEAAKSIMVVAYDNQKGVTITDNHKGWNYLSNPYMVAISGAEADSKLVVGYLRETGTGPWEWVDDTYRYVTIPSDDGKWYDQQKFKEATLLPFKSFFLQIAESGELSFDLASRQNVPARYLQNNNEQREVEFEVLLANDTRSDNLGFLIGEDYTPAYEINADLEKMIGSMSVYTIYNGYNLAYNALSPANAEEQIPIGYVVPTVGEYTFALDESSDIEDVEHIYLIDYETSAITDLVTDIYTFTALEQKSDTRFAINVALKSKDNAATGLDNMNTNGELPTKFIYHDKIFILHHGVIYDATGKRVITINK